MAEHTKRDYDKAEEAVLSEQSNAHDPLMPQQQPPPYPHSNEPPPGQGYPTASEYQPPTVQYIHQRQGDEIIIQPAQRVYYNDYLGFSIFNLLCCCCCIGIFALIKSTDVRTANQRGDPNAEHLSKQALRLNKIALGIGICVNVVYVVSLIILYTGLIYGTRWLLPHGRYDNDDFGLYNPDITHENITFPTTFLT